MADTTDLGHSATEERTAERVGLNDATFRAANEKISEAAGEHEMHEGVPFICECAEETCREIVPLSLEEYEEVRTDARHFVNVPGHEASAGPHARVIARFDHYFIVAKVGRAGEIVEDLDPRADE